MTAPVNIKDSKTGNTAKVSKAGQLIVAPIQYSDPISKSLNAINTAFNFVTPEQNKSIVITDIIASADKNVSNTTPANVVIYEALAADTLTVDEAIVIPQLVRASNVSFTGLNILVPEGKWINAKTDDANILVTIMFYRISAEDV